MKFFGVHIEDLESDRFFSASNDQIATWLFLHALCCKLLNGGRIIGARSMQDRFWGRHGLVKAIIDAPSPLWTWDGEDLIVKPYDIDGQKVYERKVAGGKTRAIQRWGDGENRSPIRSPKSSPDSSCNAPNPTQPNPREKTSSLFPMTGSSTVTLQVKAASIYAEYPKKVGKTAALKAINKAIKAHSFERLLERTKAYCKAIGWQDRQFIPHPATWFNEGRFDDDPMQWEPSNRQNSTGKNLTSDDVGI